MSVSPKAICRVNATQLGFFPEFDKLILKLVWRVICQKTGKISLKKKIKLEDQHYLISSPVVQI